MYITNPWIVTHCSGHQILWTRLDKLDLCDGTILRDLTTRLALMTDTVGKLKLPAPSHGLP